MRAVTAEQTYHVIGMEWVVVASGLLFSYLERYRLRDKSQTPKLILAYEQRISLLIRPKETVQWYIFRNGVRRPTSPGD